MTSTANIFRLKAAIQNYDWGKQGSASLVARYARGAMGDDYEVDEDTHYAEIWMGTHQNGPASLWGDPQTSLHGLAMSAPRHFLGARLTVSPMLAPEHAKFPHSTHVPFLFKVLSIARALPLQAHPDKHLGEKLHRADPAQFVDANHKPEIAVALADGFRGFVGFRPPRAIAEALARVPELREAVADERALTRFADAQDSDALKTVFTRLLAAPQERVARAVAKLADRIERQGAQAAGGDEQAAQLVLTLHAQYPGDVGVLAAPFFMNLVALNRGEAVYIGADEAHAYLEGDIIECMAVSDNVLNAAFVPPGSGPRNTAVFADALTYTARPPAHWALASAPYKNSQRGRTAAFDPPLEEFTVLWTRLPAGEGEEAEERLTRAEGPTIGLVTRGTVEFEEQGPQRTALRLAEGAVLFVKPQTDVVLRSVGGAAEVWWATCVE
ncbi:mannose-6-phosphate isomerase [Phellopilus nigrolimitatus]|nr:mannose-6-phosphate isomerase [Phellopilus nigrolimitatus]